MKKAKASKSEAAGKPPAKKSRVTPDKKSGSTGAGNRPIRLPPIGTNFKEAVGKVVAYINFIDLPNDWQALEIRFTDGTSLNFELRPTLRTRIEYNGRTAKGDVEILKDYGVFGDQPE